jgi:hypothetical protein
MPTLIAFVVKVPSARFAAKRLKRRKMEQKNRAPLRAAPVILGTTWQ